MRRTTFKIDDDILRYLKKKAAEEGRSLQSVTNEVLRKVLVVPAFSPYRLKMKGWDAEVQPGVDLLDRGRLFDLMDGE